MTTTVEHRGGVGINSIYRVERDGEYVGYIEREANRGWRLHSRYYDEVLAFGKTADVVKQKAITRESYPTAEQVYEAICQRVEGWRRKWAIKTNAEDLAQAAADLASGSNSAHDRIIELHNKIEAFAKDRSDVGNQQYIGWQCGYEGSKPTYTDAPEQYLAKQAEAAAYWAKVRAKADAYEAESNS